MQRFFDILFSILALIILLPLLVPISLLLRLTGEGEIFYCQERIGKAGKPFRLYKFATMLKNSPNMGTGTVTLQGDPRILPMGQFLRKTKINELPQLLNILLGDMSIVGPRPLTPQTFCFYSDEIQATIVKVPPGLSGIGSIIFREEEAILAGELGSIDFYRSVIGPYKGQLEAWYVHHQGLCTYFRVILTTLWVVLFPHTSFAWKAFPDLPSPPAKLKKLLYDLR